MVCTYNTVSFRHYEENTVVCYQMDENIMLRETSKHRTNAVGFHLYEVYDVIKLIQASSGMVTAKDSEEQGNYRLLSGYKKFQSFKMKKF